MPSKYQPSLESQVSLRAALDRLGKGVHADGTPINFAQVGARLARSEIEWHNHMQELHDHTPYNPNKRYVG